MKSKLLICDTETMGILCVTTSESCAASLSEGIFNIQVILVPDYYRIIFPEWNKLDFDRMYLKFDNSKIHLHVSELESHLRTEEFNKKRAICIIRRNYIETLEHHLNNLLQRTKINFDPLVFPYIETELLKCDTEMDVYTESIREYADHNSITGKQAYQELSMLAESHGKLRFRLFMFYKKYVRRFNQLTDGKELEKELQAAIEEIFVNARL